MSAQPVDVLAVMDRAMRVATLCDPLVQARQPAEANSREAQAFNLRGELPEARAAVAELMAERDRYENALYLIANGDLRPGCIGSITKTRMGEIARAALARVGGAA